jgi:hypothetical protein
MPKKVNNQITRARSENVDHPQSAQAYAGMTLIGSAIGVGLLFFYVYQVPKLIQAGAQGQVFYLLLIPWGLSCAAFLFGAMRSYARFTYKRIGSVIELSGPVVLFCLVVIGGFKLVPPQPETFDLTVRAHAADGKEAIIKSGKITIDLENDRRTAAFGPNGEANFKGIPPKFMGATIQILPQADGYEEKWLRGEVRGKVLDIALERAHLPLVLLHGTLMPAPARGEELKIIVEGQPHEALADEFGRFEIPVNGNRGDRIRLRVYAKGKIVYDDYQTLPGPVTLARRGLREE